VAERPHFGLSLPNRGVLFGATTAAQLVRLAEWADRSGVFGSVWVGDSLLAKPRLEAIALLSGIATRTSRVRLGTVCMASMTLRDPILLAIQWASLDQLAGGRTILGACLGGAGQAMGAGALENEIYGVPNRGRTVRLEEEIALLRRLWLEDEVTFEGHAYRLARVTALPKPLQAPPPIWIATNPKRGAASDAVIERALTRVGRLGDGYMTDAATVDEFRWRWSRVRHHAAEAGRDPETLGSCIHLMVNVNPDPAAAFAEADRFLRSYYGVDFGRAYLEAWVASGPPDAVAARVRAYLEAGCTVPILRFASWQQEAQLDAFLAEVAPRLRDLVEPAPVAAPRH
jgi:alkanesulfonate monooxygenase SsuD/methylene tetrahydromethanopterin reductase-like flavin-dependent oxidoreductase (luciferase family)